MEGPFLVVVAENLGFWADVAFFAEGGEGFGVGFIYEGEAVAGGAGDYSDFHDLNIFSFLCLLGNYAQKKS